MMWRCMGCRLIQHPIELFDPELTDTSRRVNNGKGFSLQMSISEQAVQTEHWEGHQG